MNNFILWSLYITLFFYCIVDGYQTKLLLDLGAYELNPWLLWLMNITGTWVSMLLFKAFLLIGLGVLLFVKYNNRFKADAKSRTA
jgi:hypothetical protein